MGLDLNGIRFLAYLAAKGEKFEKTGMLGRQFFKTNKQELKKIFVQANIPFRKNDISYILQGDGYSERFLAHLGSKNIDSFDNSKYENATYLHDFNKELPSEFKLKYDLFIDGGSLEHIFNFPKAITNCLRIVSVGGVFVSITPCNNLCGHGFYQFSPELFYSILNIKNGFEIIKLFVFETRNPDQLYEVKSPAEVKNRIEFSTRFPCYMMVAAKKVNSRINNNFLEIQQSDYIAVWEGKLLSNIDYSLNYFEKIKNIIRRTIGFNKINRIRAFIDTLYPSPFDSKLFKKTNLFI